MKATFIETAKMFHTYRVYVQLTIKATYFRDSAPGEKNVTENTRKKGRQNREKNGKIEAGMNPEYVCREDQAHHYCKTLGLMGVGRLGRVYHVLCRYA